MDATRQEMAFSAEKMEMLREQGRMAAQEALKAEGAAAKAAQAAQEAQLLKGLAPLYQTGDRAGFEAFAAQNGIPVTWENYLPAAAMAEGVMDVVNAFKPPEAPEPLTDIAKMRADLAAGRMTQTDFDLVMAGKAARGTSFSVGPDGTVQFNEGAGVNDIFGGKPPTEGQLGGAGYLQRMTGAEAIFNDLASDGVTTIPLVRGVAVGTRAEGYALSGPEQRLLQAQRDWVRAKLRKESGAVIAEEEMRDEMLTYFPQPGDSAETIAQKAEARKRAERQMEIGAGPAAPLADQQATGYAAMSKDQLMGVDINSLTAEELDAFEARWKEVAGK
jgi:hypothetical protein